MIKNILYRVISRCRTAWYERYFISILIVAAIVMMALSLFIGLRQSVWFDEAYSILLAKQPFSQLIHLTVLDTHPPLYYLLLKFWAGIFGWSELALRSLSVLAMGGATIFAGLFARRWFGMRTALIALPFMVFSAFLVRYSFEIRMYALASLIGIAATYVLTLALESKTQSRRWILYGIYAILVAVGVYTLYYMVLLWVAHLVWLIWSERHNKQTITKAPWLLAFGGSILLFLPWIPTFLGQIGNGALAQISQAMTIDNFIGIISFSFVYQPVWQLGSWVSLLVLFVTATLVYFVIYASKNVTSKQRPYFVLLAMYVVVPIAILTLISLVRPMYVERYLAHVLIGGSLFVGVCVAIVTKKSSLTIKAVATLLFVIMFVGIAHLVEVGNYNFQRLQMPSTNQVASVMRECETGTTVMASDPYVAIELSYYLPHCDIHFYSDTAHQIGGYEPLSDSALRVTNPADQLKNSRNIFYVYFDQPRLHMPERFVEMNRQTYGSMTVSTFSAE